MSLSLTVALIATLAMPSADPCDGMRGHIINSDGTRMVLTISDDAHCLRVTVTGRVEFTDDDADVKALEPGSTLTATESRAGDSRTLTLTEHGGRLERTYTMNGAMRPAAESATWLRDIVLELVRGSGFGAEARVARIRRQRGVNGVLDEVARLRSDHVKRIYLEQLLQSGRLSDDEIARVALTAGQRIGSDHDKSQVLRAVTERRGDSRDVAAAVVTGAESIGSDHDRGEVLGTVVGRSVLGTPAVRSAFFRALDAMGSDHDRGAVLEQLARRDATSPATGQALLASAARLGSDHDKAAVLVVVAGRADWMRDAGVRTAFSAALKTVGSDSEYRRVARIATY